MAQNQNTRVHIPTLLALIDQIPPGWTIEIGEGFEWDGAPKVVRIRRTGSAPAYYRGGGEYRTPAGESVTVMVAMREPADDMMLEAMRQLAMTE